jgi:hypothetical protein
MLHPQEGFPAGWKPFSFTCDGRECWRMVRKVPVASGIRFNCFLCDYDLCLQCVILNSQGIRRRNRVV